MNFINILDNFKSKLRFYDTGFLFLAATLIFLPSFEALKNIFAFLFVISWVYLSNKNKNWGGQWQIIDLIFLLWILADIFVSINAVVTHDNSGSSFRDIIRFVLIAWITSRSNFSDKNITQLALIAVLSTCASISYSYYVSPGDRVELYSVGHINHTAIFMVIAYAISSSALFFNYRNLINYERIILGISSIFLFWAVIDTGSRATFGLLIVLTFLGLSYLLFVSKLKKIYSFLIYLGISIVALALFSKFPPDALQRLLAPENMFYDNVRYRINNLSYYAFKSNPFFGIGFGNYGELEISDLKKIIIEDQGVFDPDLFLTSAHAHNVYFTYLVSGGLLIFSIFIWFWMHLLWMIYQLLRKRYQSWLIPCGIGVMLINLVIGWVNTSLHHEHAILSMFILGLVVAKYRKIYK